MSSTCVSSETSRSHQILRNWSCRAIVSHPMWLPRTKVRSSGRITSALNQCTVLPAPNPVILVLLNFGGKVLGLEHATQGCRHQLDYIAHDYFNLLGEAGNT